MKVGILLSIAVLCACSAKSQRQEVQRLLDQLDSWSLVRPSLAASNRLIQLKDAAIPVLLAMTSPLQYENHRQIIEIGNACYVLGTNAHPVLRELLKDGSLWSFTNQSMPSRGDNERASAIWEILERAGPAGFQPLMELNPYPPWWHDIRMHLEAVGEYYPEGSLNELVRLYWECRKCANLTNAIGELFEQSFRPYENYCDDISTVLRSWLKGGDSFLMVTALDYLARCGPVAVELRREVNSLLTNPDPDVRRWATKALNRIDGPDFASTIDLRIEDVQQLTRVHVVQSCAQIDISDLLRMAKRAGTAIHSPIPRDPLVPSYRVAYADAIPWRVWDGNTNLVVIEESSNVADDCYVVRGYIDGRITVESK